MTKREFWKFRRLVKDLREKLPTKYPIKVRRQKIAPEIVRDKEGAPVLGRNGKPKTRKYHGYVVLNEAEDALLLIINIKSKYADAIETLVHEWAHAMVWPVVAHGKMFGVAYAQAYTVWERLAEQLEQS